MRIGVTAAGLASVFLMMAAGMAHADQPSWTARPATGMDWDDLVADPAIASAFKLMGVGEARRYHQPNDVFMGLIMASSLSDSDDAVRRQQLQRLQELAYWGAFRYQCLLRPEMPPALAGDEAEDFAEMLRRFSPNVLAKKPFPDCGGVPHEDGQVPRDGDHGDGGHGAGETPRDGGGH